MVASEDIEEKRDLSMRRLEAQLVAADQKVDRILQYLNLDAGAGIDPKQTESAGPPAVKLTDRECMIWPEAFDDGNWRLPDRGSGRCSKAIPTPATRTMPSSGSGRPIIGRSGSKKQF